jgi:HrpA-like RNA helicase
VREHVLAARAGDRLVDDGSRVDFEYSEAWAIRMLDRGGSRTDRCLRHRQIHRQAIQGLAVPYIDVQTISEIPVPLNPGGPLGGLGELPAAHQPKTSTIDLSRYQFGMKDSDILDMLRLLANPDKRVLILKAGTGTGKSTFAPLRLMSPPNGAALNLTSLGPIIVTEPRVQATIGVARFVGEKLVAGCPWRICDQHGRFVPRPQECCHPGAFLPECTIGAAVDEPWQVCSIHGRFLPEEVARPHPGPITEDCSVVDCADHIGPGYPVGYQVKGDRNHDDSCQLVYVTDGTMINWLREGRLGRFGAVIVDEAHERSANIDFILGYLKRELGRFPQLRVIVTSATFEVPFFVDFFGGSERVAELEVPAAKAFGYGSPLFPSNGSGSVACGCETGAHEAPADFDHWLRQHWLASDGRRSALGPVLSDGYQEDLWDITTKLHDLRFDREIAADRWRKEMPGVLAEFVVRLVMGLDDRGIFGDILAFLPTEATILIAAERIRDAVGSRTDVYELLAATEPRAKERALAARARGERRKVVVSTNLAETSLTVEGVRFVVDSGLIAQSEWNATTASMKVPTGPHSRAGIRQRWGRVGRDGPGWVFPLYPRSEFDRLRADTPPGSTRSNLEQLVLTAKAGGVDSVEDFPWPASSEHQSLDPADRKGFRDEVRRATAALRANGALDSIDEDITAHGRELQQLASGLSAAHALAVIFADQLACVPEVVTAVTLLEGTRLTGNAAEGRECLFLDNRRWSDDWRGEAHWRHDALFGGCQDDLDVVLRVATAWEYVDSNTAAWDISEKRAAWARQWWVSNAVLLKAANARHEVLKALSPNMSEAVKRRLDPRLVERARAVISRAMRAFEYVWDVSGEYIAPANSGLSAGTARMLPRPLGGLPERLIPLSRRKVMEDVALENIVVSLPWASDVSLSPIELMALVARAPRGAVDERIPYLIRWPVGSRLRCTAQAAPSGETRLTSTVGVIAGRDFPGFGAALRSEEDDEDAGGDPPSEAADGMAEVVVDFAVGVPRIEGNWPTGSHRPEEERDLLERRAVLDPSDPDAGLETNDDEHTSGIVNLEDSEDAWLDGGIAWPRPIPDTPTAVLPPSDHTATGLQQMTILCGGYCEGPDGALALTGTPDPLLPSCITPWSNPDLEVGATLAVTAGPLISSGTRLFFRADGMGEFYVSDRVGSDAELDLASGIDYRSGFFVRGLKDGASLRGVTVLEGDERLTVSFVPHISELITRSAGVEVDGSESIDGTITWINPANRIATVVVEVGGSDPVRVEFRVAGPVVWRSSIVGQEGESVRLALRPNPRSPFATSPRTAEQLAAAFPEWFSAEISGTGGAIKAKRPLPMELYSRLMRQRQDEQWARRVAAWVIGSHHRVVERLSPRGQGGATPPRVRLPRLPVGALLASTVTRVAVDGVTLAIPEGLWAFVPASSISEGRRYEPGQEVMARICGVDETRNRYLADLRRPVGLTFALKEQWREAAWAMRAEWGRQIDGSIFIERGGPMRVSFDDIGTAAQGAITLRGILGGTGALVTIPEGTEGQVRGSGLQHLLTWRALPGIVFCDFRPGSPRELLVLASHSDVLVKVVAEVAEKARAVVGLLETSADLSAALENQRSARLLGYAEEHGWLVQVRSEAVLGLMSQQMGIPGRVVELREAIVRDVVLDQVVNDWRTHQFDADSPSGGEVPELFDLPAFLASEREENVEREAPSGPADPRDGSLTAEDLDRIVLIVASRPKSDATLLREELIRKVLDACATSGDISEDNVARSTIVTVGLWLREQERESVTYVELGAVLKGVLESLQLERTKTKVIALFAPHLDAAGLMRAGNAVRRSDLPAAAPDLASGIGFASAETPSPRAKSEAVRLREELTQEIVAACANQADIAEDDVARLTIVTVGIELRRRGLDRMTYAELGVVLNEALGWLQIERSDTKMSELFASHLESAGLTRAGNDVRRSELPAATVSDEPAAQGFSMGAVVEAAAAGCTAARVTAERGAAVVYLEAIARAIDTGLVGRLSLSAVGQGYARLLASIGVPRSGVKLSTLMQDKLVALGLEVTGGDVHRVVDGK